MDEDLRELHRRARQGDLDAWALLASRLERLGPIPGVWLPRRPPEPTPPRTDPGLDPRLDDGPRTLAWQAWAKPCTRAELKRAANRSRRRAARQVLREVDEDDARP